ncbi:glycosyltransferase [Photorhabdus sp. APURE]|uniref:glycosyltransferase n=1 Tax=Photorhabdus aballayi TaxID=2991723 RepID=UPI00223E6476|nr:glycosyltransferase [Photorhabdus aballayi]MCW7547504.1 glycosyltransferase [Photorhabdus aballayi]
MINIISSKKIAPAVIVINGNYISNDYRSGFKVGATSFALKVADYFIKRNLLSGFILYKRDESLISPKITEGIIRGIKCINIFFNFSMKIPDIRNMLEKCISILSIKNAQIVPAIVYYQTDTLLSYHPPHIPCCITHHGPFVEDFQQHYSLEKTYDAFENKNKAQHLNIQQMKGIEILIDKKYFVFQHSKLQGNFLLKKGIKPDNIKNISPPIFLEENTKLNIENKHINDFIKTNKNELLLFTAVARLDYFKNIELLINSAIVLLDKNIPVKVFIAGDEENNNTRRNNLISMVPSRYRSQFFISHKLSQMELLSVFNKIKNKSIFVCTSRYETLGITPLEAALNGVCTILPNLNLIEAASYFSSEYKFTYNIDSLTEKIISIYEKNLFTTSQQLQHISSLISMVCFEDSMEKAWEEISISYMSNQNSISECLS